jgi:hypothetical protein
MRPPNLSVKRQTEGLVLMTEIESEIYFTLEAFGISLGFNGVELALTEKPGDVRDFGDEFAASV